MAAVLLGKVKEADNWGQGTWFWWPCLRQTHWQRIGRAMFKVGSSWGLCMPTGRSRTVLCPLVLKSKPGARHWSSGDHKQLTSASCSSGSPDWEGIGGARIQAGQSWGPEVSHRKLGQTCSPENSLGRKNRTNRELDNIIQSTLLLPHPPIHTHKTLLC